MKRNFTYVTIGGLFLGLATLSSCVSDENSPGVEYMPDMYRSPAIEAYVDYGQDPFYVGDSLVRAQNGTMSARKPVEGTVPFSENGTGWVGFPYPYDDTPEGYDLAGAELKNPVALTAEVYNEGARLFDVFCTHCHGAEGKGDGKIVTNGNFPPVPAYDGIEGLNEGKMFHTLTYGKGNMGSHASQLDKEERWKVIWFVKSLQTGQKLEDMMGAMETAAPDTTMQVAVVDAGMDSQDDHGGH